MRKILSHTIDTLLAATPMNAPTGIGISTFRPQPWANMINVVPGKGLWSGPVTNYWLLLLDANVCGFSGDACLFCIALLDPIWMRL